MTLSKSASAATVPFKTFGNAGTAKHHTGKSYYTPPAPPASALPLELNDPALEDFPHLWDILSLMRPDDSPAEWTLIERYILPTGAKGDSFGNYVLQIGESKVLWSSHTDTVHKASGRQKLLIDQGVNIYADNSDCLGADCGTGVWLMLQMIGEKVPGRYVFHRSEESGGRGSGWIAEHTTKVLEGIDYAIAFDRKGTSSIITHQWGGRCCSEAFSLSLSAALGMGHKSDDTGSFTDTANYTDKVSECTNLSVGYDHQHSAKEFQNLPYLARLLKALLSFDESLLTASRDPAVSGYSWEDDMDGNDQSLGMPNWTSAFDNADLEDTVYNYPNHVAALLMELGYDDDMTRKAIKRLTRAGVR